MRSLSGAEASFTMIRRRANTKDLVDVRRSHLYLPLVRSIEILLVH